mmetsp:Transcript_36959/g.82171  ORF Transcript_36959/g.82171 Transcript_36959/m.82171 type:complete len:560 (+) Transcript_36959:61-1740(+)|eukprot:CAMPEP_0202890312 /NCGR_PEP_ID=MMETSP1392-20130828/765_1 /ASSEMBLY_ACC=CAM_ASM_000868 /TAXON_ID=225041 /ORGANISM="Chlamydomonas chlamydogama, Strain SAG 11-48b" /LENGTH=559 /DNA_ID=CAMNT_0049573861 /DNA_START=61 /DNA_END=1740 /DNA_ORIENTATION=-
MRNQALRLLRCAGAVREALQAGAAAQRGSLLAATSVIHGRSFASVSSLTRFQLQGVFGVLPFTQGAISRSISTSASAHAQPVTEVATEGDAESLLTQIDSIVSSESSTAKEVADAAVALAYLQVKGNRRVWGKVFERAAAVKDSFDAASLSSFLWAATTAGVTHFKTVAELSGPAASLLKSFTPTQLSIAVEAFGHAGLKDAELHSKITDVVIADLAKYKGADLARILWGYAAAHVDDVKLAKAVSKALADKAGELSAREAVQGVWALAKLRRTDKPALDALVKAAGSKLSAGESAVDAAALAWAIGFLGYKADAETAKTVASVLKAGAAELSPAHAIDAAWGLAVSGAAEKDAVSALFGVAAAAVEAAPGSVDVYQLGALYNAAVLVPEAKLPPQVLAFANKLYNLGSEHMAVKRSSGLQSFKNDLADSVARALGARYRPEVAAAVKGFSKTTADGVVVDIAVDLDGTKVAIEAVGAHYLSATHPSVVLGPVIARKKLLEAAGYKVVDISVVDWSAAQDAKAKAATVLKAIKTAAPSTASKVDALQKKLDEPFDAFAE